MQPGDKTRAPLRFGESVQGHLPLQLRLTVVFHPDLTRIGASTMLGTIDSSGALRLETSAVGRNAPLLTDEIPLNEPHISRRALKLSHHARGLLLADISGVSHCQLGPDKSASMAVAFDELKRGLCIRFGHGVVCWLRLAQPQTDEITCHADTGHAFVGVSHEAQAVRRLIATAAQCDLPTLICGETGAGKEIVARSIHEQSERRQARLVAVNMAALPETLADAELFGVTKGAYTGAEMRDGYFQKADGGSLFLDEMGEAPLSIQPKLLRALQEGEIQVVGGRTQQVDARIIAATDARLTNHEAFNRPLLNRLAGITINVPSLSDRREDLGLLLLAHDAKPAGLGKSVPLGWELAKSSPKIAAAWAQFFFDALNTDWAGNVRAFLLAAQRYALSLPKYERHWDGVASEQQRTKVAVDDATLKREHEAANFEIAETARRLGLSRQAVYRRLQQIPEVRLAGQLPDREFLVAIERVGDDIDALSRHLKVSRAAIIQRLRQLGARK